MMMLASSHRLAMLATVSPVACHPLPYCTMSPARSPEPILHSLSFTGEWGALLEECRGGHREWSSPACTSAGNAQIDVTAVAPPRLPINTRPRFRRSQHEEPQLTSNASGRYVVRGRVSCLCPVKYNSFLLTCHQSGSPDRQPAGQTPAIRSACGNTRGRCERHIGRRACACEQDRSVTVAVTTSSVPELHWLLRMLCLQNALGRCLSGRDLLG